MMSCGLSWKILNSFIFNYYYVYKYNESLGLHNGTYQLRKLYRNEINDKKNFLVLDFMQPGYYKYHIDNISLLQGDINYLSIDKFLEKFKDPDDFIGFLKKTRSQTIILFFQIMDNLLLKFCLYVQLYF